MSVPEELAERMRAGDDAALAEAFEACRPALRRLLSYRIDPRLRGRVAPSDVLQEAYLEALKRLAHYAKQAELDPGLWLRWIVGQQLVDVHRRQLAQKRGGGNELSLDRGGWAAASSLALAELLVADGAGPPSAMGMEERKGALAEALEALSPLDREVLSLRHFEDLSNDEVAALLGLKKSAASKRYVRALAKLRAALEDTTGEAE